MNWGKIYLQLYQDFYNIKSIVKQHIHWDIIDPAKITGTNEEKLNVYKSVRDLIAIKIKELDKQLS